MHLMLALPREAHTEENLTVVYALAGAEGLAICSRLTVGESVVILLAKEQEGDPQALADAFAEGLQEGGVPFESLVASRLPNRVSRTAFPGGSPLS